MIKAKECDSSDDTSNDLDDELNLEDLNLDL